MLTLSNFSIYRREKQLFREINLTILPGSILCFHGHNGVGKTSILRAVATSGAWTGIISFITITFKNFYLSICLV